LRRLSPETKKARPDACYVGRDLGRGYVHQLDAGGGGQQLSGPGNRQRPLELRVDAQGVAGEDGHANARGRHGQVGDLQDLAALVAQLVLLDRLVVDQVTGERQDVEGDRSDVLRGRRELDGAPVPAQLDRLVPGGPDLLVQLGDRRPAAARDGLVGGHHQAAQAGLVVEHLQRRHGHHGRAVRVGDDPLGHRVQGVGVDLGHHEGHVGVLAPRRAVVDHDGAGRGDQRCVAPGGGGPVGAQGDVDAGVVGALGVLHLDVPASPRQAAPGRARRAEEPHVVGREGPLGQDRPEHLADLARRTKDPDSHGPNGRPAASVASRGFRPVRRPCATTRPPARPRPPGSRTRCGWVRWRSSRC
jgi:hypothetical protein